MDMVCLVFDVYDEDSVPSSGVIARVTYTYFIVSLEIHSFGKTLLFSLITSAFDAIHYNPISNCCELSLLYLNPFGLSQILL